MSEPVDLDEIEAMIDGIEYNAERVALSALVAEVRALRAERERLLLWIGRRMTGDEISEALSALSRGIRSGGIEIPSDMHSTAARDGVEGESFTRPAEPPPYHFRVTEDGRVEPTR